MNDKPPLSILVIDDHALVRAGIVSAAEELSCSAQILGAVSIAEGCKLLEEHPNVDLVLLDLVLPDAIEFSGLEAILDVNSDVSVILLTADSRRETIEEAFRRGACGYIPKSSNLQIIVNALRIILAGGRYLPEEMLGRFPSESAIGTYGTRIALRTGTTTTQNEKTNSAQRYGMTCRQNEVADLLKQGLSNKEICRELDLGMSTVKTHVTSILRALRITSRAKAIAMLMAGEEENSSRRSGKEQG